jgi:phosphatidylinositol 4-phosphatase
MSARLPFRDLNVYASSSHYAFTSPSSPDAPTLVIDRPSGDLRLNDGKLTSGNRVSSISGILGIIKLRLGKPGVLLSLSCATTLTVRLQTAM